MNFDEQYTWLKNTQQGRWSVMLSGKYEHNGSMEHDYTHFESTFVANQVRKHFIPEQDLLDIGSYYHFLLGMCCCFKTVTNVDVRPYAGPVPQNLKLLVTDAKKLPFPDKSFYMITSQCTLEHIGLGMYGDDFDFSADYRAVEEMKRVLKPGGFIILTTTISANKIPAVVFNAHRVYNQSTINRYFHGLNLVDEGFYNITDKKEITKEQLTTIANGFDVYGCCWQKGS